MKKKTLENARFFDLSQTFVDGMSIRSDPAAFSRDVCRRMDSGDGFNCAKLHIHEHVGTHMDAPFHFENDGRKIAELVPEEFFVKSLVLDFRPIRPREGIDKAAVLHWESVNGEIPAGTGLVLYTGWARSWGSPAYLTQAPGLREDAAEYLAAKHAPLIGIDCPSVDVSGSKGFPAHHAILSRDILIVENLSDTLEQIAAATEFYFVAAPLKVWNGTGSPVRAIGICWE